MCFKPGFLGECRQSQGFLSISFCLLFSDITLYSLLQPSVSLFCINLSVSTVTVHHHHVHNKCLVPVLQQSGSAWQYKSLKRLSCQYTIVPLSLKWIPFYLPTVLLLLFSHGFLIHFPSSITMPPLNNGEDIKDYSHLFCACLLTRAPAPMSQKNSN